MSANARVGTIAIRRDFTISTSLQSQLGGSAERMSVILLDPEMQFQ